MIGTRSYWQARASDQANAADVVVVGAGITGASAAYWIRRRRPDARVIVLDRGEIAAGASGRNAGFLLRGTARNFADAVHTVGREQALRFYRFTAQSIAALIASVPGETCELSATGSLLAAGDAEEDEELRMSAQQLREAGEEVAYWPRAKVSDRLGTRGFHGGLFDPAGATVDPLRLVRRILLESGADVRERQDVRAIEEHGGRHEVTTDRDAFTASRLILATNAYLPALVPELDRYVRPVRAQMMSVRPADGFILPIPLYSHRGYFYARSTSDGTLLIGGARHLHEAEEVGFDDATTPTLQYDLERYVLEHLPGAGAVDVERRWSGVMGFSPDGLPVVGQLGSSGAYWAAGFTGHGMAFGFGIGRLLAHMALGLDADDTPALFSPDRIRWGLVVHRQAASTGPQPHREASLRRC